MDHHALIRLLWFFITINFLPTLSSSLRQEMAFLAQGGKARRDTEFYSSLHEPDNMHNMQSDNPKYPKDTSDFTGSCWDVIRAGALDSEGEEEPMMKELLDTNTKSDLIKLASKTY